MKQLHTVTRFLILVVDSLKIAIVTNVGCLKVACVSKNVCSFDKEMADIMQEMKKGGVMEFHRKPVPPLSALSTIDSRQWQGLNMSFLHSHYPGELFFTYYLVNVIDI